MERYANLSAPVETNIYAVPNNDSLVDYLTYRLIMTSSGIEYTEIQPSDYGLKNCDGALLTKERVLLTERARSYFARRLDGCLRMGEDVVSINETENGVQINGETFDYVIDATWGHLIPIEGQIFFETTLLLYYKTEIPHFALTMVDGDLCSLYPTGTPGIYTLSSVLHTPIGQFKSSIDAKSSLAKFNLLALDEKTKLMESQISKYLPDFCNTFKFVEPQLSIKTKLVGESDDRSCYVSKNGRKFTVMSGKIDTIFFASERILSLIEAEHEMELGSTL
jgi:hypothetical protein